MAPDCCRFKMKFKTAVLDDNAIHFETMAAGSSQQLNEPVLPGRSVYVMNAAAHGGGGGGAYM